MNADALINEAVAATGLTDLGPDADLAREGLESYLASCAEQARLNELGTMVVNGAVVAAVSNRLRVVAHHAAHPDLAATPITAPVIVVGLFRAGTTLLSNLLNQDAANRSLLRWESGDSVPPPSPADLLVGPRVDAAQGGVDMLEVINPAVKAIHHEDATSPTECISVLAQAFQSISWQALAHVPSYAQWWRASDMTAAYRYHRSVLQVLGSAGCGGRWVLKSPGHALALDALTTVYPDARLVVLHRDPVVLTASVCSLIHTMSAPFSDADHRNGIRDLWTDTLEQCIDGIDRHADRMRHVQYADLLRDPAGTVSKLYADLGLDAAPGAIASMAEYVASRPKGQFGTHRYDLDSYGLNEAELRERFSGYTERYRVETEMSVAVSVDS
jgi:hypothetical protein